MRTITTTLYRYHELPTEDAKARARQWWIDLEERDPAWASEHTQSMRAAFKAVASVMRSDSETDSEGEPIWSQEGVARILRESLNCEWTGYCADGILWDNLKDRKPTDDLPSKSEICGWYANAWDAELDDRLSDDKAIAETLEANEYEFTATGDPA